MRFWDSSALLPATSNRRPAPSCALYANARDVVVWVLSDSEVTPKCLRSASGLCRLAREGAIADAEVARLGSNFEKSWRHLYVVGEIDAARLRAKRLLHAHPLRAADALQLAVALIAVEDEPRAVQFATLDERLGRAASREGFAVVP